MISWILLGIFSVLAGILTLFAPCSLPLIPAYVANAAGAGNKKTLLKTALFGIGFIAVFALLGFTAGGIGKLVILHKRQIVFISALLFISLGILSILGISLFRKKNHTYGNNIVFGALFSLTWGGCIGPILGLMLVLAANTQTAIGGGILLVLYAIGLLLPLFLLSLLLDKYSTKTKLWRLMQGKIITFSFGKQKFYTHTTNIIAGGMFVALGILLLINLKFGIASLFPAWMTDWTFNLQDKLADFITLKTD